MFVLAPLGGVVADRLHRQRVLVATQSIMMVLALILAALTLSGYVQAWHVFLLASLLGVTNAFDIPARQAFLVEMVGHGDIVNAVALNSSMLNGARIVGPAVAGIVVAAVGEGWCFLLNAISYVAVIGALLLMHVRPRVGLHAPVSAWASVVEGFTYSWHTRSVRALLLLLGLVSLMGMPYTVLMPIIADRILHGGPHAYRVAPVGVGRGRAGGRRDAHHAAPHRGTRPLGRTLGDRLRRGVDRVLLLAALWLSALLLVPAGFFMMVEMAASNTLIQSMVPDRLRGRVMAVYSMMFMGMAPIGALGAGMLAAPLGAPATVALGGAICIAGGLIVRRRPCHGSLTGFAELIVTHQAAAGAPPDEATQLQE